MADYQVLISPQAYRELDIIYAYICEQLKAPMAAENLIAKIEQAVLSLKRAPYRGAERKTGFYANQGYRQLFVGNYTILYRVVESNRQVLVVTVRYMSSEF